MCSMLKALAGSFVLAVGVGSLQAQAFYHGHDDDNTMTGVETDYGTKYLGIPYAEPPVGDLRWKAPQLLEFPEDYDATTVGAGCPQAPSAFGLPSVSEDCLYLNVYEPEKKRGFWGHIKRPVMVWIHGGAFTYGEGHTYDPEKLVEEGVVVVTVNYRLGALGFMAHPALTAEGGGASGNYGLMDQQAALQWVQDNIERFGGDPDRVTIFGESAGGLSVHAQIASPKAEELFSGAIIQSGAYALAQPPLQQWEYLGAGLAAAMGCPDQSLSCLRSLSVEQILANQDPGPVGWLPVVDGDVLPQTVQSALQSGDFNKVPVIEGTTRDEYSLFTALNFDLVGNPVTAENYYTAIAQSGIPVEAVPAVASFYPLEAYSSPGAAVTALGTDFLFACNSLSSIKLLSQHVPTYGYEFDDPNAPQILLPPVSFPYGSFHSSEIQYLLGTNGQAQGVNLSDEQKQLSDDMVRYWTSFAKFRTPNLSGAPLWIRYGSNYELMKSLKPTGPVSFNNFAEAHQCDLWSAVLGY
ncbi:carboxylesterase/lipase family protein [Pseudomaricurvus sp.]|uniref:carboxylesterase/lipase family protein n=1 Tax=Pseudomaricurvus sp. TaxID=2004510 RepID=UPI003F6D03DA